MVSRAVTDAALPVINSGMTLGSYIIVSGGKS